jgi:hypothetical protein
VNQLKLPLAYADQLYVLRDHVATVGRRPQTGFYGSAQLGTPVGGTVRSQPTLSL